MLVIHRADSLSDNLVIYIGEPDSNESPTCQAVQGQGGYKSNPVAADTASHLLEGSFREWKPVRGGPSFDTLLRVLSCIVFGQTILDCDKPVVPHPEAVMPFS